MLNSLKRRGHTPPNKVIHDAGSECIALEVPHQPCSPLACEMGSYHGLTTHKVVRARAWASNLVKLHQPSATSSPFRCYGSQWSQYQEEKGERFGEEQAQDTAGLYNQGFKSASVIPGAGVKASCVCPCLCLTWYEHGDVVVLGTQRYESAYLLLPINKALGIQLPSYQLLITTSFLASFPSQHVLTCCATEPVGQEIQKYLRSPGMCTLCL